MSQKFGAQARVSQNRHTDRSSDSGSRTTYGFNIEKENNKRHRGGGKPGKGDKSKPDGQGAPVETPPAVKEPPATLTYFRVRSVDDTIFANINGGYPTLHHNGLTLMGSEGEIVKCKAHGPGWYCVSSNEKDNHENTIEPAVQEIEISEYCGINPTTGTEFRHITTTYQVDVALWKHIMKTYRNTALTSAIMKGARSLASASVGVPQLSSDTVDCFLALCARNDALNSSQEVDNILGRAHSSYRLLDPNVPCTIFGSDTVVDLKTLTKLPHKPYPFVPGQRALRGDFKVLSNRVNGIDIPSADLPDGEYIPLLPCKYDSQVRHSTIMLKFHNEQATIWDSSSSSMNEAATLRTFVAAPPQLAINSHRLASLTHDFLGKCQVSSIVNARPQKLWDALDKCNGGRFIVRGEFVRYSPDCADSRNLNESLLYTTRDSEASLYTARMMAEYINLCSRSLLVAVTDGLSNAVRNIAFGSKAWFLEQARSANTHLNLGYLRGLEVSVEHAKRAQRQRWYNGELVHEGAGPRVTHGEFQVKTNETAKIGADGLPKGPRGVVAYGKAAIISTTVPCAVKACSSERPFRWSVGKLSCATYLITENTVENKCAFFDAVDTCRMTPDSLVAFISSDDMCVAFNVDGVFECFNGDIAKNDRNCESLSFFSVYVQESYFSEEVADAHLDLACLPIVLETRDRTHRVKYKFSHPTLQSGLPTTTLCNNVSSQAIVFAFSHLLSLDDTINYPRLFTEAATVVGHEVTIDKHTGFYCLQVLKHSPFVAEDGVYPYLNLGTIFRGLGTCDGDLDCIKCGMSPTSFSFLTPDERTDRFIGGVVRGLKNQPSNAIIGALRARFCPNDSTFEVLRYTDVVGDYDSINLSHLDNTSAIYLRYGLEDEEVETLIHAILNIRVGQILHLSAVRKMLSVDYGWTI